MKYNKDHKRGWLGVIRDINNLELSINRRKWLLINMGKDNGMINDEDLLEIIKPKQGIRNNATRHDNKKVE